MKNDRSAQRCADAAGPACDEDTTAAIARDYLQTTLPVREILERHGLKCGQFYQLARQNGWPPRRTRRKTGRRRRGPDDPSLLLDRLRKLARRRITALETLAGVDDGGLAGHERLAKALNALLALLTRIEQLQAASKARSAAATTVMTPEEADERRQKLAQMLVKMLEQASGQRLPGGH
jgi:type VI protein secretion system component VasK